MAERVAYIAHKQLPTSDDKNFIVNCNDDERETTASFATTSRSQPCIAAGAYSYSYGKVTVTVKAFQ
jgi:hypothetical protein